MPVSDRKKISNANWDKRNMATIGCRVKKEEADAFKQFAEAQGKTSNTVLKEFVQSCITNEPISKKESLPQKEKPAMIVRQTDDDLEEEQDKESDLLPWEGEE